MNMGMLFGKRTWIGVSVTMGIMTMSLLLGALFAVRGTLPMKVMSPWLWVSYGLAALIGGRVAVTGQGRQMCALVPGVLLYILVWLLALCSECSINFAADGVWITVAVAAGTMIALLSRSKKKKRNRHNRAGKKPVTKTVRR